MYADGWTEGAPQASPHPHPKPHPKPEPAQTHLDEYLIFSFARHPVDKFESAVRQFWLQQEKRNETLGQPLQATSP